MRIALYLLSIVTANLVTSSFPPMNIFGFIVPMGSLLIGATFILRNLVQMKYGRKVSYLAILFGLILSAISSVLLGDTLLVTIASAISFAVSESSETEVFTRLKRSLPIRALYSGIVGGVFDSAIFVVVGLSPLFGANIVPWPFVLNAVLGQVIIKSIMQVVGASVMALRAKKQPLTG